MKTQAHPSSFFGAVGQARGFTLIELLISLSLGMVILGAIAVLFMVTSQTRDELERHSRQVENGRFAVERVREEVRVAGFFGEVLPTKVHWQTPSSDAATAATNNCDPTFGWDNDVTSAEALAAGEASAWQINHIHLPTGIGGINNAAAGTPAPCVANVKAGTDILFIRRVDTAETTVGSATQGVLYLQNSFCTSDTRSFKYSAAPVAADQATTFDLRPRYCGSPPSGSPAQSPLRRAHLTVFFVATCNDCSGLGDGIPTLKRLDYTTGSTMPAATTAQSVVDGIDNLQFEFGIDANDDGAPEVPFVTANNVTDWSQVVAIKTFVLSRSLEERPEYPLDTKSYVIASDGTSVGPFGDRRRRQLMSSVLQLSNVANWRESF